MEMSLPRIPTMSFAGSASRSVPSSSIFPSTRELTGESSRIMAREVTLLPLPLSPTIPRVSPRATEKFKSRMIVTACLALPNRTVKSLTSNRLSFVLVSTVILQTE